MKKNIFLIIFLMSMKIFAIENIVDIFAGGGGFSQNATYSNFGTFGQTLSTISANSSYTNREGFLYAQAPIAPLLSTNTVTSIGVVNATSGGDISFNGNSIITNSGILYSLNPNISVGGIGVNALNTTPLVDFGLYSKTMSGLLPNTTYYVRAYASNDAGIGYGSELSFTTVEAIQARRIVFTKIDKYELGISFIAGNGESRIVLCKEGAQYSATPLTNGTTYLASNYMKRGTAVDNGYVVYNGIGNTVLVRNLNRGKLYFFRVFEYYGDPGNEFYIQSTGDYNPNSKKTLSKELFSGYDFENPAISIYPNPATDKLNLNLNIPNEKEINIQIFDMEGNLVLSPYSSYHLFTGEISLQLDISKLYSGTYNILITSDEDLIYDTFSVSK